MTMSRAGTATLATATMRSSLVRWKDAVGHLACNGSKESPTVNFEVFVVGSFFSFEQSEKSTCCMFGA